MAKHFSTAEWDKIFKLADQSGEKYGLPESRRKSVVMGSLNIRKIGSVDKKSEGAWKFLALICKRFDLIAIQEVQDNLDGIRHLKELMGKNYGMVVTDTTGKYPGDGGSAERLAFLFNWSRVNRTEVASDITYDRTKVVNTLFDARDEFWQAFDDHEKKMAEWKAKIRKGKPVIKLPKFLTFIRQPSCVSFSIGNKTTKKPYEFLAVNVHLLYGKYPEERRMEFHAILSWIIERARNQKRMYYPNILFMGDCNLEFKNPEIERPKIEEYLKTLNKKKLKKKESAKINFPFLDVHPTQEKVFRTSARLKDTYDQIALISRDKRLPGYKKNALAGTVKDGYDFGVFNFVNLFSTAIFDKPYNSLLKKQQKQFIGKFEHDLTDHLPIWIRLPIPD